MLQLIIRLIFAWLYSALPTKRSYTLDKNVAVIIPVFNEDPHLLSDCIASVLMQTHQRIQIIVVDDGSTVPVKIPGEFHDKVELIRLNENQGKMRAQAEGIYKAHPSTEFILTVDSDTIIGRKAVQKMLEQFDEKTGAVCGEVRIMNIRGLNHIVEFLYWNSFHIWRAGSSFFGQVSVCSGAISMYRLNALEDGILQEYLDRNVEVGNDRYITYLFLKHGWKTRYASEAVAITDAPTGWKFIIQQVRWNKSFWRGLFYSFPIYSPKNWYFTLDMAFKTVSRILTIVLFLWTIMLLFRGSFETVLWILFIAFFYGLIHSVAGLVITRRPKFLLYSFWAILSIFVIAPVNIWAMITAGRDKWGTR